MKGVAETHRVVIFRGHNEEGQFRIPADESARLSLQDLAKQCHGLKLFCVFLTCQAARYLGVSTVLGGPDDVITISEALRLSAFITERIANAQKNIRANPIAALGELKQFNKSLVRTTQGELRNRVFLVVLEGVIVGVLLSDDDRSRKVLQSKAMQLQLYRGQDRNVH
jgi:hypothetical protein